MTDTKKLRANPPKALNELASRLEAAGHATWWVGESLHDALCKLPTRSYALATDASSPQIVAELPRAVPVRPDATAFIVPSALGPIDLAPLRVGPGIESDLAHRGFTILALAWRFADSSLVDPHGGARDLGEGRLRCVGDPETSLLEAPTRVLQAARLVAQRGYTADPTLRPAMTTAWRESGADIAAADLRREFDALLMSPRPGAGIRLLQKSGIDRLLGFRSKKDAARLLDAAPRESALRWAIWLRGGGGKRCLYRVRLDYTRTRKVRRLLDHHPLEEAASTRRRSSVRRLAARLQPGERAHLLALREAELAEYPEPEAREIRRALDRIQKALEREERAHRDGEEEIALNVDGHTVAGALGIEPGPELGRALAFLRTRISERPDLNTRANLLELLRDWQNA